MIGSCNVIARSRFHLVDGLPFQIAERDPTVPCQATDWVTMKVSTSLYIALSGSTAVLASQIPLSSHKRPNFVFILTDDQDVQMDSLDYMPHLQRELVSEGTLYNKHFCTVAICCPSRVNIWTGKAAHNTNVTDINPPYGE